MKTYPLNWAKGRRLDNCPVCGLLPILDGEPVKMHPLMGFLYTGSSLNPNWACPTCGSVFDGDNNLLVMGKPSVWPDCAADSDSMYLQTPTYNID